MSEADIFVGRDLQIVRDGRFVFGWHRPDGLKLFAACVTEESASAAFRLMTFGEEEIPCPEPEQVATLRRDLSNIVEREFRQKRSQASVG